MYSKFPFSMENIPRQRSFGCLSLKFGCILTALIVILYTLLSLSQGCAVLMTLTGELKGDADSVLGYAFVACIIFIHVVSFVLTAIMLLGALKDKAELIKPWVVWKSLQLIVAVLMFVFWNTMNMINQFADTSLLFCAVEFLAILIRFYMLVLVTSFYKQLEEDKEETERLKNLLHNEHWYTEA